VIPHVAPLHLLLECVASVTGLLSSLIEREQFESTLTLVRFKFVGA
jgi:hypothetical protein